MKILDVKTDEKKSEFYVSLSSGKAYAFPYAKAEPEPTATDKVAKIFIDEETGNETFTFVLESGKEGLVHAEQLLDYHLDPEYMARMLTHRLSVEAKSRMEESRLSCHEAAKRLDIPLSQLRRLVDTADTDKPIEQLIALLYALRCDVDLVVKKQTAA